MCGCEREESSCARARQRESVCARERERVCVLLLYVTRSSTIAARVCVCVCVCVRVCVCMCCMPDVAEKGVEGGERDRTQVHVGRNGEQVVRERHFFEVLHVAEPVSAKFVDLVVR